MYNVAPRLGTAQSANVYNRGGQHDPALPFPAVPPPPLPPAMAGAWGSVGTDARASYMPGGTWQQAAVYNGSFPNEMPSGIPAPFETAPIASSAARERERMFQPDIAGMHQHRQQQQQQQQQQSYQRAGSQPRDYAKTASGLEVHAMQRLVSSARTRLVPGHQRQDQADFQRQYELRRQGDEQLLAQQHARREQLLNAHRDSGGVAFEKKMRKQRQTENFGSTAEPVFATGVHKSVLSIDGTFRRPKAVTPTPSSGLNSSRATGRNGERPRVPLSQAHAGVISSGVRPQAVPGTTTKSHLKGQAPDLTQALAEGFGERFQPEQIERMRLPPSVAAAAVEAAQLRVAAGGLDNSRYVNPAAPESAIVNGLGDMFQRIKHQYTQIQVHPERALFVGSGRNSSTISPPPKVPFQQKNAIAAAQRRDEGSPLRVPVRAAAQHHPLRQNNNNSNNMQAPLHATPLYAIAGSGALRGSGVAGFGINSSATAITRVAAPSSPNRAPSSNGAAGGGASFGSSAAAVNPIQSPVRSALAAQSQRSSFDAPKPSSRALQLRAELELLEQQWKTLHDDDRVRGGINATAGSRLSPSADRSRFGDTSGGGGGGASPQQQSARDTVLGRISAVLR